MFHAVLAIVICLCSLFESTNCTQHYEIRFFFSFSFVHVTSRGVSGGQHQKLLELVAQREKKKKKISTAR